MQGYKPLAVAKLDEMTSEKIAGFAAYRQTNNLQISTINSSLGVLRRALWLAVEHPSEDAVLNAMSRLGWAQYWAQCRAAAIGGGSNRAVKSTDLQEEGWWT